MKPSAFKAQKLMVAHSPVAAHHMHAASQMCVVALAQIAQVGSKYQVALASTLNTDGSASSTKFDAVRV